MPRFRDLTTFVLTDKQTNRKTDGQNRLLFPLLCTCTQGNNTIYQAKAYCHHRQQREGLETLTEPGTLCILNI